MRYEAQLAKEDSSLKDESLREECLKFSVAHANQFDPLLSFLDELSDVSRFRTLESNLQSCLLLHLAELIKVFSASRLEKLFKDLTIYFSSVSFCQVDDSDKTMLQNSCWKGLYQCLDDASLDSLEYIIHVEKCMEVLFTLLPAPPSADTTEVVQRYSLEWSEAVRCLGKARRSWLLDFLQVYDMQTLLPISVVTVISRNSSCT